MDFIKEAFQRVRADIDSLKFNMENLNLQLNDINESIMELRQTIIALKQERALKKEQEKPLIQESNAPTHPLENQTQVDQTPTHNTLFNPLKDQNLGISTGNEGVPTDKQTHQQTNRHTENTLIFEKIPSPEEKDVIKDAADILDSLDTLKKEIRLKFKRLTEKELLVFSTLYSLDEEYGHADYKNLAIELQLTESSIRDYVGRLISKGIPVDKVKVNNKTIHLRVSESLKKVASLSTILKLIDL